MPEATNSVLSTEEIDAFMRDGFVRLDNAFPAELAAQIRTILFGLMGCDEERPETWSQPAIRLGMFDGPPFVKAANTERLTTVIDQLVGPGRWRPCGSLGTFRCAFPVPGDPGDIGWHVDVSFNYEDPDFMQWRVNLDSRGRALLLLFLFSDTGPADGATRLRIGSHRVIARALEHKGPNGMTLGELVQGPIPATEHCPEARAVGAAGTVYICHPFLVHAGAVATGDHPRLLAQPPILPSGDWGVSGPSAVERATANALADRGQ